VVKFLHAMRILFTTRSLTRAAYAHGIRQRASRACEVCPSYIPSRLTPVCLPPKRPPAPRAEASRLPHDKTHDAMRDHLGDSNTTTTAAPTSLAINSAVLLPIYPTDN
jgi:hypothetical protein